MNLWIQRLAGVGPETEPMEGRDGHAGPGKPIAVALIVGRGFGRVVGQER